MSSAAVPRPRSRLRRWVGIAALSAVPVMIVVLLIFAQSSHPQAAAGHHTPPPARRTHRSHGRVAHVAEVPDPLAAESFPDPAGAASHARAGTPLAAGNGAPSLGAVEQELRQEHRLDHSLSSHSAATLVSALTGAFTPRNVVPLKIAQVIAGGNAIADFPYVYGGGHASFEARAYDCSGSVSYALAAAGLLSAPETSGQLETWGAPGPGRWLTVFANAGHTFMNVDGVWFDTAGRAGPYSTRWLTAKPSLAGYAVRHYPGL
jgi:cell wall-associated NlpC family hydrolase